MSALKDPERDPAPAREDAARVRKPYVKPAVIREAVFETTALACGKINPTQRQCQLVRKQS